MGDQSAGDAGLRQLVGLEVSAVCFVRDYVELHFDCPVLRALSDPFGRYGCQGWHFPEGNSPTIMRYFIGETVDEVELIPNLEFQQRGAQQKVGMTAAVE